LRPSVAISSLDLACSAESAQNEAGAVPHRHADPSLAMHRTILWCVINGILNAHRQAVGKGDSMLKLRLSFALLAGVAALAGCHSNKQARDLNALDNSLANDADPALAGALNQQIMVDPDRVQQANGAAIRPPAQPYSAESPATGAGADAASGPLKHAPAAANRDCPACSTTKGALTLGELAKRQRSGSGGAMNGCSSDVNYSAQWANRLGDLPVYPGAHVSEAAGSNGNGCALRIVSFTTTAPADRVIDYYYTQATGAGYDASQQSDGRERVLGGTRSRDGGAYVVFVDPSDGGGSSVDLVVNNGK
jgi:hypothetical protein